MRSISTIQRLPLAGALALLALASVATPLATAATSTPAWSISTVSYPTNFAPKSAAISSAGPAYQVLAVNVGGAATAGEFTIVDTLPAGVTPAPGQPLIARFGRGTLTLPHTLKCEVLGQVVTCSGGAPGVRPGEAVELRIPVKLAASVAGSAVNQATISGGGAPAATASTETLVTPSPAAFGFLAGRAGLGGATTGVDGSAVTQAGAHPYQLSVSLAFPSKTSEAGQSAPLASGGGLHAASATLPPGMVANPAAVPECKEAELESEKRCRPESQIGTVRLNLGIVGVAASVQPLYNMVALRGAPATFGFEVIDGTYAHLEGEVRSGGDYELAASSTDIVAKASVLGVETTLWGDPSAEVHDSQRGSCLFAIKPEEDALSCPVERTGTAFLTMPTACSGPLTTTARADSWEAPGAFQERSFESADLEGNPVGVDGCNKLEFEPTISSQPTTNLADSPAGLDFNLHQPQAPPAEVGQGTTEVCARGNWSTVKPLSAVAFQWLRNGTPIPGAASREYEVGAEDLGSSLQCEVVAGNDAVGPGHAVSPPVLIQPAPSTAPPTPAKPVISADTGENPTLTCNPGSWGGEPSFAYRWFKDGTPAPGQTASTYQVQPGEKPLTLQCEVSGSNAGGTVVAFSANWLSNNPAPSPQLPDSITAPDIGPSESAIPLATAALKDTKVALPARVVLNPSAAGGRSACSSAQIGLTTLVGQAPPIHFSEVPQSCPDAAKVGSVEVSTPLLDHRLPGAVYLAKPFDNPFGSLLGIYLAIEDPETGVVAKLAGKVEADPTTGQLTTTFTDSPQLPLEDVELHLFNGPRAALTTPFACGRYTTTAVLTPWSTPEGADATPSDSFETTTAPGGGPCPSGEANAPNAPSFTAGTVSPQAGAYSPFVLKLSRPDGSQRLTAIDATLPKGLTGKLAGIPYCSEAQIAQAQSRNQPEQGALELSSPSCPLASEVGTVNVGAGSGITPLYVTGHAYLAGPYKGAPLSLAIVTPAVAGPFDLGVVTVRTALRVDPETAQIHAVSDPLPTILQGIPLDVRSIALKMDRPSFTLNPTSCDPMAITGSALAATGQSAALSSPFQVGGCSALKFKPKLALKLKGGTKRTGHPALTAVATAKPGEANIAKVSVALPHSAFLDQAHIKTICTRVQFSSGAIPGEGCPKGSIYGKATATTPLLTDPISGPVYLRSSSHELPDLVAALHGQVDVVVAGRVDSVNGGIRNSFEAVPDAPVTKFTLQMQGGKKGLIVNSRNICNSIQRATVKMLAQNGKTYDSKPLIKNSCKQKAKKKHGHRKKRRR
jgi:hypothetical protein